MSTGEDLVTIIRIRGQVITLIGIDNSCLDIILVSQISGLDPNIVAIHTSIFHMEKIKHVGMVTTVKLVSFTRTTTRINLDIVASLLVGAILMRGKG